MYIRYYTTYLLLLLLPCAMVPVSLVVDRDLYIHHTEGEEIECLRGVRCGAGLWACPISEGTVAAEPAALRWA